MFDTIMNTELIVSYSSTRYSSAIRPKLHLWDAPIRQHFILVVMGSPRAIGHSQEPQGMISHMSQNSVVGGRL